ncbi:MAG: undecaprenyl-phosphate glucose phosphotransferase [Flammeovirgaceae bacterium]|nr:undecaprenyl-phosphate glucose phosphotransferase [Flammeovirgaceae bacterium]|tara:strand:+ start:187 stop:1566 length:1380 start_codon:yes stop_codon:yes gene_type:complete
MAQHRYSRFFPIIFVGLDLVGLNISYLFASYIQFGNFLSERPTYLVLQLVLNLIWLLTFFSSRLQEVNRESRLIDHLNRVLTALVVNLAIVFAFWFAAKPFYYSRQHLFFIYLYFSFLILTWRVVWHYSIRFIRSKGYNYRNIVVVGYSDISTKIVSYFQENPSFGYRFLGYFHNNNESNEIKGNVESVAEFCLMNKVDFIYLYMPVLSENESQELIDFADNNLIKVKIISQFSRLGVRNMSIQNYGSIPVVNISAIPLDNRINQTLKRAFDILFSGFVMLTILSWLIPIIGMLIKIESPGPVFFRQHRNGLNNKKFLIFKFRTMVVHKDTVVKQATKSDSRITKIGAILRKTSIDELPQFLNVFLGNMSVVGPRPHAVEHNEEYSKKIDRFIQRHAVRPGITGLAQAKGFRGETITFNDISGRVRLDRFYVKNWSLLLDIKIILLTIISILKGSENAY